jgi:hypothetical protein
MTTEISGALSVLALVVTLGVAVSGWAQEKVGVVTTVIGPVTVARASLPPEPLKFRDDVFLRDRVTTGDAAITRILLGGKVVITAREHTTLTITETPGLSTIHLTGGRIAVAVEKTRMKPGERVDIRTPNAVAGVRGTVLIVEAEQNVSTVTVLRGLVHVERLNSATGAPGGPFTLVGARQTVSVRDNVLPARPKAITSSRAEALSQEFTPPLMPVTPTAAVTYDSEEMNRLLAEAEASVPPPAGPTAASAAVRLVAPALATPGLPTAPTVAVTAPVPAPTALPAPTATTTTSLKPMKYDRYDRSGSNSGRR